MVTIKVTARSLSSPMTAQSREWWKMPVTLWVPRRWFLVSKTRRRREGAPDGVRVSPRRVPQDQISNSVRTEVELTGGEGSAPSSQFHNRCDNPARPRPTRTSFLLARVAQPPLPTVHPSWLSPPVGQVGP